MRRPFSEYPYINFSDFNFDWIIKKVKEVWGEIFKLNDRLDNFIVETKPIIEHQVDKWLDEHPEATTTVEDHSLTEVKFTEELANKTVKDYYTPQMFGAKGDGVTDDTEAFNTIKDYNPVVIPVGDYLLTEDIKLNHVELDLGNYVNYKPLYKKDLNLNLSTIGFGKDIMLPVDTSYVEAVTYFNNSYYAVCRNYVDNVGYIAIYNDKLEFIRSLTLRAIYENANSIHNDGEYLYIDFDNGYHVRFNADLTGEFDINNTDYRYIIPYNKYFYAVKVGTSGIDDLIISKMLGYGGSIISTDRVAIEYDTPQAATIIDGILILSCVFDSIANRRYVRLIDMATYEVNKIPYNSISEVENFFEKDGVIKASGHIYGYNGTFNIGDLNGIDYPTLQYTIADGSIGIKSLFSGARYNAYRIINGTMMGFPEDVGDFLTLTDFKFFISNKNKLYYYKNNWHFYSTTVSTTTTTPITIGSNSFNAGLRPSGSSCYLSLSGGGTAFTNVTSNTTIGTIPEAFRPKSNAFIPATVRTNNAWQGDVIPVILNIDVASGDIKLVGNTTDIQRSSYITAYGSWNLAN